MTNEQTAVQIKELSQTATGIREEVLDWLTEQDEPFNSLQDLMQHGCVSGMVPGLIYYSDTVDFYERNKTEISEKLSELLDSTGCSVNELFGRKWDESDPLANDRFNQNLLAWFGFEEVAREVAEELGIYY